MYISLRYDQYQHVWNFQRMKIKSQKAKASIIQRMC